MFAILWLMSDFETDEDGDEYNVYREHAFTFHESEETAKMIAQAGSTGYALATGIIQSLEEDTGDWWEPVSAQDILVYEDNDLTGKYIQMDMDGWRWYPVMSHWEERLLTFPPQLPEPVVSDEWDD